MPLLNVPQLSAHRVVVAVVMKTRHSCHESSLVTFLKIDMTSGTGPKNVIDISLNFMKLRIDYLSKHIDYQIKIVNFNILYNQIDQNINTYSPCFQLLGNEKVLHKLHTICVVLLTIADI